MNRTTISSLGIAILLLFFCHRIWNMGTTHHDDAEWRLAACQGDWSVVSSWAVNQGRVFAIVSGALLYIGIYLQDTTLGAALHVGSFVMFFAAFHALLMIYFSARVGLLAAVLNLGLFALRWEGSIVVSYPLFSWTLGTLFVASVYFGWRYSQEQRPVFLWLSFPLLFVSLNIHEGVSVLLACLAVLAVAANYYLVGPEVRSILSGPWDRRFLRQLSGTVGVVGLYFLSYAAFRLAFPSHYEGNKLGSLNPVTVVPVLLSLSTTGSVLTDLIAPYKVTFADSIAQDGYRVIYKPLRFLFTQNYNAAALLSGFIVAFQVFALVNWTSADHETAKSRSSKLRFWLSILVGALIALLPVLPVALVGKYQEHFYNLHIRSYAFTPLCHFGWTLIFAAVLCRWDQLRPAFGKRAVFAAVAGCLGVVGYCSSLTNDAIAADMRRETCRWTVMDQLATILPQLERPVAVVHIPRLQSGSWFTVLTPEYWSQYTQARYGRSLRFENSKVSRTSIDNGLAYVDYVHARDNAQTVVFAAAMGIDSQSQKAVAHEIAVLCPEADPSDKAEYLLSYRNLDHDPVVHRFADLVAGQSGVRLLRNTRAIPSSIRISRQAEVHHFQVECGERLAPGAPVLFGVHGDDRESGEIGVKWLSGGWHQPERASVWSSARSAEVRIPLAPLPGEKLSVTLYASTCTGLGCGNQPQTVTVRVGDRDAVSRKFMPGDGWQALQFDIDPSDLPADGTLRISLLLDNLFNPAKEGVSADTRDLGVCLQRLIVDHKVSSSLPVAAVPDQDPAIAR